MTTTSSTGNWRLGLTLVLATVVFWATLGLALKFALEQLDPMTLTWLRFLVAFGFTAAIQLPRGALGRYASLDRTGWWALVAAAVMLISNYVLYLLGLHLTTPGNAQVLIQLAPLTMTLGGIFLFGEKYSRVQWMGFVALIVGLGLFSSDRLGGLAQVEYLQGSALIVLAALTWGAYAMAQKYLLSRLSAQQIVLFIYASASLVLLPFSHPTELLRLDTAGALVVGYCAFNTLGAYGAFAEALRHWEASRISAVLAITPLGTLACVAAASRLWPDHFSPEPMTLLGWIGALAVVAGSTLSSLGARRRT